MRTVSVGEAVIAKPGNSCRLKTHTQEGQERFLKALNGRNSFSLPALLYLALSLLPFIFREASEDQRQREQKRRKEGAPTRGHEKREETTRSGEETENGRPYQG
ncbi:hypothetical protein AMECASPLE_003232 [Ameca splendens]|uniref:Uncharacterized protein n=1 Tax=Ameca splendens TaxID=208324 RepID=A0ABV0YWI1_9TELE